MGFGRSRFGGAVTTCTWGNENLYRWVLHIGGATYTWVTKIKYFGSLEVLAALVMLLTPKPKLPTD